jgi:hypothetical protein
VMQVRPLGVGKGRLTCGSGDRFLRVFGFLRVCFVVFFFFFGFF